MWSIIPWRRIIVAAYPFLREVFLGKGNIINYLLNHRVITILLLCNTITFVSFFYLSNRVDVLIQKFFVVRTENAALIKDSQQLNKYTTFLELKLYGEPVVPKDKKVSKSVSKADDKTSEIESPQKTNEEVPVVEFTPASAIRS